LDTGRRMSLRTSSISGFSFDGHQIGKPGFAKIDSWLLERSELGNSTQALLVPPPAKASWPPWEATGPRLRKTVLIASRVRVNAPLPAAVADVVDGCSSCLDDMLSTPPGVTTAELVAVVVGLSLVDDSGNSCCCCCGCWAPPDVTDVAAASPARMPENTPTPTRRALHASQWPLSRR